jgi:hypothetical protein
MQMPKSSGGVRARACLHTFTCVCIGEWCMSVHHFTSHFVWDPCMCVCMPVSVCITATLCKQVSCHGQ